MDSVGITSGVVWTAHAEQMAVRMCMANEGKRDERQMSISQRGAICVVSAQHGADRSRKIIAVTKQRLPPTLRPASCRHPPTPPGRPRRNLPMLIHGERPFHPG